jgi:cysteinyl-tRNA synthetase
MELQLYNTLTRRAATFVPLDRAGKRVTFYSCGPTVYNYAHIGNFRSFLNADLLRRTLELFGFEVVHVMNMTDVGHMTEDSAADGAGEDRMQVARRRLLEAKKAGTLPSDAGAIDANDPRAIAEYYVEAFLRDARRLGLTVALDYQAADGTVYYDVRSFPDYGRLSGNTPESVREAAGGRVDRAHQAHKRHPADFLLWKPDPKHIMRWPSPWGEGYPGWHLECSVMAMTLLGKATNGVIDIHSGGEDNIFPHHECEIAQARGANGQPYFARYWFHTRHLVVEGEKMAKSKGNFFTVGDLLAKGASPAAIRLELTKTHYRSNANFTMQGLRDSQRLLDRWARLEARLRANPPAGQSGPTLLGDALGAFAKSLADDLNVAKAIGVLNEAVGGYPIDAAAPTPAAGRRRHSVGPELDALRKMLHVLGVLDLPRASAVDEQTVDAALIEAKINERNAARAAKDWTTSDRIRDELVEMGIALKDGPNGTTWTRTVR